jgi:tRNA (guanine-N7-)-methyltransferase
MTLNTEHPRTIRSYVIRGGRLTASQQQALETCWPTYGLEVDDGLLHSVNVFGRQAPLVLEIGFGMGDSLLEMAIANPDQDFIGVEVHRPGVGRLLHEIAANQLTNLRIYCQDAKEVLLDCILERKAIISRYLISTSSMLLTYPAFYSLFSSKNSKKTFHPIITYRKTH